MMGHRERLIDGDEYDALTAAGKRVHRWRAGQRTSAKRSVSRRARRKAKARIIEMEGGAAKADAAQQEAPRRGPPLFKTLPPRRSSTARPMPTDAPLINF
jgi:hypothetical protein